MDKNATLDFGLCPHDGVDINRNVWFRDRYEMRAVFVDNKPFYSFERNDEVQVRFCAVQLVEAELAKPKEVCNAFGIAKRTFSRSRTLVRQGGIAALVKEIHKGPREATKQRIPAAVQLYREGKSTREIARLIGISASTVGRILKDQGVPLRGNNGQPLFDKTQLPDHQNTDNIETPQPDTTTVDDAEKNVDVKTDNEQTDNEQTDNEQTDNEQTDNEQTDNEQTDNEQIDTEQANTEQADNEQADNEQTDTVPAMLSSPPSSCPARITHASVEATSIPYASPLDRALLKFGLIDEAPVEFESSESVAGAGALLGLALLEENGLLEEARGVYGSLQKCWYGLRPMIWTLLVMAWLRIKKPEQIKGRDPATLGRLLGLPRAPEVKTIRRKLAEIADRGLAAEFHRRMAMRRAEQRQDELCRLYIDGHVRVYYGQRRIGKTHVTRLNSWERGETDYWVHDGGGEPLLVVRDAANEAFTKVMREQVLPEIRRVIGPRRVRVVFDRVGWCQELFRELLSAGFDFMTYRCHPYEPLEENLLQAVTYRVGSEEVVYELAESTFDEEGWPPLRLIAVRRQNGGQTHIVASGRATWEWLGKEASAEEPRAEELAWGMFGRWTQENWFKYMMEEYDLDVLLEYTTEPDDPEREVPNPAWRKLDKEVATARGSLRKSALVLHRLRERVAAAAEADAGKAKASSCESCGRCLQCRLSSSESEVSRLEQAYESLLARRRSTSRQIRLGDVADREGVKLSYEGKLFSDTVKLSAYEIETRLYGLLGENFVRRGAEGRSLIRMIFANRGDLVVNGDVLEVHFEQLSSPRYTSALQHLCASLNALGPLLPESELRLSFHVKPRPVGE